MPTIQVNERFGGGKSYMLKYDSVHKEEKPMSKAIEVKRLTQPIKQPETVTINLNRTDIVYIIIGLIIIVIMLFVGGN